MEQVRDRVRLLALLLLVAFSFDPLVYFVMWAIATVAGYPVILGQLGFRLLDLGAVAASGALWWVARRRAVSADRLHTLGLLYQVAICIILALTTFWQSYLQKGMIPSLTWVPVVVILFPLILPGPPRRMLMAASAAGAMAPLALLVLDLAGQGYGTRTGLASGGPGIIRPEPDPELNRERFTYTRKQVSHANPEGTHRAVQPAGAQAG